jgi:hypothetical protein
MKENHHVQFPLNESLDIVKAHRYALILGPKCVYRLFIAIVVKASKRFLTRLG